MRAVRHCVTNPSQYGHFGKVGAETKLVYMLHIVATHDVYVVCVNESVGVRNSWRDGSLVQEKEIGCIPTLTEAVDLHANVRGEAVVSAHAIPPQL